MDRFPAQLYLGKEKESATLLVSPGQGAQIEFSGGGLRKIPLALAQYKLKGDPPTTLEIAWVDEKGEQFLYCKDSQVTEILSNFPSEEPFVSTIKELRRLQSVHQKREKNRLFFIPAILAGLLFFVYMGLSLLVPNLTRMIPVTWDIKIGALAYEQFLTQEKKIAIPAVTEALAQIVDRIDDHDQSEMKYEFSIIEKNMPNAFAFPGGHIIVTSELIRRSTTPEEVAGVLAHELTHVLERHGMKKLIRKAGLGIIIGLFFGDASSLLNLAELASGLEGLSFDREQERKADEGAVRILQSSGISPTHLVSFFKALKEAAGPLGKNIPELLSTHPLTDDRITRIAQYPEPEKLHPFEMDWAQVVRELAKK